MVKRLHSHSLLLKQCIEQQAREICHSAREYNVQTSLTESVCRATSDRFIPFPSSLTEAVYRATCGRMKPFPQTIFTFPPYLTEVECTATKKKMVPYSHTISFPLPFKPMCNNMVTFSKRILL